MITVLYVDDNPDDRLLFATACRRASVGFALATAETGGEALAWLAACADDQLPALVLVDLKMPDRTGIDVLRGIRADARTREVYVALYSSSVLASDLAQARAEGVSLFVEKPGGYLDLVEFARDVDRMVTAGDPAPLEARGQRGDG